MNNKIITVITGTRKGIGRYLAEYYSQKGHIVIGCSRGAFDFNLENYHHFELDVGNELAVIKMFHTIKKKFGRVDHLLNNAGIASMNHSLLTPLKTVTHIFNTNFIGTFLMCRESAKMMCQQKYGRIINFATVATPLQLEGEAIYASSKAAIVNFTEIFAKEIAPFQITINSIGPTPIETDLIRAVPKDKMNRLISRQAIQRYGEFKDVSNVTDFFMKPESSFITGQTIYLGGVS
jgi:3-oxoacyl-[acyl-carrier protein] reductase